MNPKPLRKSNLTACYALIGFGVFFILMVALGAFLMKDGILERIGETPRIEGLGEMGQVNAVQREIESKDREIELEKKMPDLGFGNTPTNSGNFERRKADKIKKLEDEKAELIIKRDDLAGKQRARNMRSRSWLDWFDDLHLELFAGIVPLGILSFYLLRLTFFGSRSAENLTSLTEFEKRSAYFAAFAVIGSFFGFFVFVWILAVVY